VLGIDDADQLSNASDLFPLRFKEPKRVRQWYKRHFGALRFLAREQPSTRKWKFVSCFRGDPSHGRGWDVRWSVSGYLRHLRIEDGVRAVYMTNNPDKLSRWSVAEID
jgi:hypothetical protein